VKGVIRAGVVRTDAEIIIQNASQSSSDDLQHKGVLSAKIISDVTILMPVIKSLTRDSSRHNQLLFFFGNVPLNKIIPNPQRRRLDAVKAGMYNR
jgi:hypothetical protein